MANLCTAVVASAMVFTIGFASASLAGPGEHGSSVGLRGPADSSLVMQVKSEHKCKWKRVCDYFAPATSCSHPPCCKKSHREKVCEESPSDKAGKVDIDTLRHNCFNGCDTKQQVCEQEASKDGLETKEAQVCSANRIHCQKTCDDWLRELKKP
jgi:hypothetical protein